MEAKSTARQPERRQRIGELARSPRLWFQRGKVRKRERWVPGISRQRGSAAINWQRGSATVNRRRWNAGFIRRRRGRASSNFPILWSNSLAIGQQPFFLREQRV